MNTAQLVQRLREPSEAQVQRACIELLCQLEIPFYRVGQRDARGTQDAGVSDLIVLSPTKGVLFIEVKQPKGKVSRAQIQFALDVVKACGRYEVIRSAQDLAKLLGA